MNSAKPLALVTGASNGIGYELATLFARKGFDLVATGRSERIHDTAEEFTGLGAHVEALRVDLSVHDEVEKVWQAVEATGRPLEAAAINAGVPPMFADSVKSARLEANLIGFSGDLYDKKVAIAFDRLLRPSHSFESVDALIEAVNRDIETVREQFGTSPVRIARDF